MNDHQARSGEHAAGSRPPARDPHGGGGGAHHPHRRDDRTAVACAIVTVSDTRSPETDGSGDEIAARLEQAGHRVVYRGIVRDDPEAVRRTVLELVARGDVEAVLTNGGTGIAARDNTYEAVCALLDKRIDGFGELFRMLSFAEIGAAAMLSRAVAGVVGGVALFSVPGSTPACRLAVEKLIVPELGHVVALARPTASEGARR